MNDIDDLRNYIDKISTINSYHEYRPLSIVEKSNDNIYSLIEAMRELRDDGSIIVENIQVDEESPDTLEGSFTPDLVESKSWLCEKLARGLRGKNAGTIYVLGSWYGNMGIFLQQAGVKFDKLVLVEPDETALMRSKELLDTLNDSGKLILIHQNAEDMVYDLPGIVINTSCNETGNEFMSRLPDNMLCLLQSRNNIDNTSIMTDRLTDLIDNFPLAKIYYKGTKHLQDPETEYDRFMVIGRAGKDYLTKTNEGKVLFKQKIFETVLDYHRFLISIKENETDRFHNCRRHPLKQYSTILEDTTATREARIFANKVMKLSIPVDIIEGKKLALIHTITMPDNKLLDIYGFTKPKTIEKIYYEDDNSIEYILFTDGSTYPEQGELVNIGGINITNTIMFNNESDAKEAYTKLWFIINNMEVLGWKVKTSLSETISTGLGGGSAGNSGGPMVGGPTTYEQEYNKFKRKGPRRITAMTNEALDTSYDYTSSEENTKFYFTTDKGIKYKVYFQGNDFVELAFAAIVPSDEYTFRPYQVTIINTGDSRKVFGTIVKIVKDYLSNHSPRSIYFTADSSEPSRIRLYDTLMSQVDRALPDYHFAETIDLGGGKAYILKRKGSENTTTIIS